MRSLDEMPQGTMHLLVHEAIALAKGMGCGRFSLCAVQMRGLDEETTLFGRLGHWAYQNLNERHHLQGLARFKNAFRPEWEPRYLVTRSKLFPLKVLWDIHCLIRAKAPLARPERTRKSAMRLLCVGTQPEKVPAFGSLTG